MLLSRNQIDQYVNEGACIVSNALDMSVIQGAADDMDRQYAADTENPTGIRQYILGPGYETLMQDPAIEQLACEALGTDAVHMVASASLHTSPGMDDDAYAPDRVHVDIQYDSKSWLQTPRSVLLTMMVFLDDVPENRAPTLVSPGSHLMLAKYNDGLESFSTDPLRIGDLPKLNYPDMRPLTGKKGDIALSTTAVLHVGSPNTSDKPRKVIFVTFTSNHVCPMFNSNWLDRRIDYLEELRSRFAPGRRHLLDSSIAMMKESARERAASE